jgi:hypothetical protein
VLQVVAVPLSWEHVVQVTRDHVLKQISLVVVILVVSSLVQALHVHQIGATQILRLHVVLEMNAKRFPNPTALKQLVDG